VPINKLATCSCFLNEEQHVLRIIPRVTMMLPVGQETCTGDTADVCANEWHRQLWHPGWHDRFRVRLGETVWPLQVPVPLAVCPGGRTVTRRSATGTAVQSRCLHWQPECTGKLLARTARPSACCQCSDNLNLRVRVLTAAVKPSPSELESPLAASSSPSPSSSPPIFHC
jgi:hypothetical protein